MPQLSFIWHSMQLKHKQRVFVAFESSWYWVSWKVQKSSANICGHKEAALFSQKVRLKSAGDYLPNFIR